MQCEQTIVAVVSMFFGAKLKGLCEEAGYTYKGAIGIAGALSRIESCEPVAVLLDRHFRPRRLPGGIRAARLSIFLFRLSDATDLTPPGTQKNWPGHKE